MTPLILLVIRLLLHPGDLRLDKLQLAPGDLQRQHDLTAGRFARGTFRACPLYLRRAVLNPAAGEPPQTTAAAAAHRTTSSADVGSGPRR